MKSCTRRDKQFYILHAQNGATDPEIRHDEHGTKITKNWDLEDFGATSNESGSGSGTDPEAAARAHRSSTWWWPEFVAGDEVEEAGEARGG